MEIIPRSRPLVDRAYPVWGTRPQPRPCKIVPVDGAESREGPRVLVVDDDERIRRVVADILNTEGYDVSAAPNAVAALEMAERCAPFALLVTDVRMPGIDGRELARRLRTICAELSVLLMSGSSFPTANETADPHTRFLPKPFSVDALLHQVDELVGDRDERRR